MRTLLLLSALGLAASCEKPAAASPPAPAAPAAQAAPRPAPPRPVMGQEARALIAAGATLLDVRTVDEFQELHLPGAMNVPLHELGGKLGTLRKDRPVVVYCAVGARSASAAGLLANAGFEVRNLGAMANWNQ